MTALLKLVAVLAMVESGGDHAAVGDGGRSVGHLQIGRAVIEDVNRIYHTDFGPPDAKDRRRATLICLLYLKHWGKRYELKTGRVAEPEVLARIWNGGPNGWHKPTTIEYGRRVAALMTEGKP